MNDDKYLVHSSLSLYVYYYRDDFTIAQTVKNLACNAGDQGLIPGLGSSFGDGNGNPLQYSCLENSMDRETWQATVHGVTKSRTRLSN